MLATRDRYEVADLSAAIATAVDQAAAHDEPFLHLVFDRVFPADLYAAMLDALPTYADYRPMSGRSTNVRDDGKSTRVKIDLFPEQIRGLPPKKREVWDRVGRALCSRTVTEAFVRRLAPGLRKRFGANFAEVGFYPMPILTRDIPGYTIPPHPDTHWKGITVQLYLPRDASTPHIGTIFHAKNPDNSLKFHSKMQFLPNTGYAFAVDTDTWHSADPVGQEVETRDSILLTYFVDAGLLRHLRNRGKRLGNFVRAEWLGRL